MDTVDDTQQVRKIDRLDQMAIEASRAAPRRVGRLA
jgi:hypothetical protein